MAEWATDALESNLSRGELLILPCSRYSQQRFKSIIVATTCRVALSKWMMRNVTTIMSVSKQPPALKIILSIISLRSFLLLVLLIRRRSRRFLGYASQGCRTCARSNRTLDGHIGLLTSPWQWRTVSEFASLRCPLALILGEFGGKCSRFLFSSILILENPSPTLISDVISFKCVSVLK